MINTINEYTDGQDNSPYAEWLASLRDTQAKAYWQDYKRRNNDGT